MGEGIMFDDFDPRDRDDDIRDIEMPWIELGRGPGCDRDESDPRDREEERQHRLPCCPRSCRSASRPRKHAGRVGKTECEHQALELPFLLAR